MLGPPVSAVGALSAPPAGWAVARLVQNQGAVTETQRDLNTLWNGLVGPARSTFDADPTIANQLKLLDAYDRFGRVKAAVGVLGPEAEATESFARAAAAACPRAGSSVRSARSSPSPA